MFISGYELKLMRECAGKTSAEMAESAGMTSAAEYEKWENDDGSPSMNQFMFLAMICGFNPSNLIKFFVDNRDKKADIEQLRKLLLDSKTNS